MSRLYDAPTPSHVSLTAIIAAVSIATFALFGGLYFASLNGGKMITAPVESVGSAPPAWVPPEERAASPTGSVPSRPVEGQF